MRGENKMPWGLGGRKGTHGWERWLPFEPHTLLDSV